MALSLAEIEALVADLRPKLEGGRIERIDQPAPDRLVLHVRNGPARYWLLLCVHPRFCRLHLLTHRPEEGAPATGFGNVVRQHMTAAPLLAVRQLDRDRVVVIDAQGRDRMQRPHRVSLVVELTGPRAAMYVLDESDRILGGLQRRRGANAGTQYVPPRAPTDLPPRAAENRFAAAEHPDDPLALSRAVQALYVAAEAEEERTRLAAAIGKVIRQRRKRLAGRLKKLTAEAETAEDAESMRLRGELLKIALPDIRPGQDEVVVKDLFDPRGPDVRIALDPTRSPQENVAALFRRYKRAKRGRERVTARLDETRMELRVLDDLAGRLADATTIEQLAEVRDSARAAGLRFPEERTVPAAHGRTARTAAERAAGPRIFHSLDGFEILVARSARESERLTFTIARGNDCWLHLLDWPGPHVIIRRPRERDVSHDALLDAAHLAIHFSRIRGADGADVTYTQVKNVRRARGGAPGTVNYAEAKTLSVRVEAARIDRLIGRASSSAS